MKTLFKIIAIVLTAALILSFNKREADKDWSKIFDNYNIKGTFLLKNVSTNELKIYNEIRSDSAYLPASTFKVLNSMIALQTSVIKNVNDTIKWDKIDKGWKPWNKDQTMKTAMPISCVWFYQDLARRIGKEQMQKWLDLADYGNKKMGKEVDNFWLQGNLRISGKEQISFIEKLIANELPFDRKIQETVKNIMITDVTADYVIHSKTGWTNQIGWNIGYIETNNDKWIFVMNQNIINRGDAKYRKKITYEILKAEGIIQ